MKRKLKFRVWDKDAKKMIYPDEAYQGHFVLSLKGEFTNLQNGVGGDEVVVTEYIGLKDKHGEDIYEGDIVSFNDALYNTVPVWGVAEVIYTTDLNFVDAPCYGLWFKTGFHKNMLGEIKVIGNIFESPELFEKPELYLKKDSFNKAMKDIEEGRTVDLDKALNETPPDSEELEKIIEQVLSIDEEREAWKRMFELQVKLVTKLELDKLNRRKMDLKTFTILIEGIQNKIKKDSKAYDLGIDLLSYDDEYYAQVVKPLLLQVFTKEGLDWIEWFIYERESFSGSTLQAWNEKGKEICFDIPSLYDTVKRYMQ